MGCIFELCAMSKPRFTRVFSRCLASGAWTGDDSVVPVGLASVAGPYTGNIHIIHYGLIVSVPDSFR